MTTISDDFNRADGALGADWTVHQGAADISTNRMRLNTGGFVDHVITHDTSLSGAEQYVKLVFDTGARPQYAAVTFRFTDSSSPYYFVYVDATTGFYEWYRFASVGGAGTAINSTNTGVTADSVGITCSGTGTSTVIKIWRNVTADAPTDANTWDGGAATVTYTDDPASPVNTGNIVGTGGTQSSANTVFVTGFFAGDIGGGGGGGLDIPIAMYHYQRMQRQ